MRVFVTGATGFIGRALCASLRERGHEVVAFVRTPAAARAALGPRVELLEVKVDDTALGECLATCDAIVNLAGAPVAQRWTAAAKAEIESSRVGLTARVVEAARRCSRPPRVLVSTSAVGIYGDRGDEELDAHSAVGKDWLAQLTVRWEAAASAAESFGVRVALVRAGLVLGRGGGMLAKTLPAFRAGLGGRLGSGQQWMPWIHLDDIVALYVFALEHEEVRGVLEGCAPAPVRNSEFTRALGRALGRPSILPVPALALRIAFAGAGRVIVAGQRVRPTRTRECGFEFRYPDLRAALAEILAA